MRRVLLTSMILLVHSLVALADKSGNSTKLSAPSSSLFALNNILAPGDTIMPGDLIKTDRQFQFWSLKCDIRPSRNQRLCVVEQKRQDNGGLVWRIAVNKDGQPVSLFALPAKFDPVKGIRLSFSGLDKIIDRDSLVCANNSCIGGFLFDGYLQQTIMNSDEVSLSYFDADKDAETTFNISMAGFNAATAAAAHDPFGREVSAKAAADQVKIQHKVEQKSKAAKSKTAPKKVLSH